MLADLAGLTDEPKGGEPAQQRLVDAGALADQYQRLHPCQLGGKALGVRFALGEDGDVVARQAGKAGQMTHLILIVISMAIRISTPCRKGDWRPILPETG